MKTILTSACTLLLAGSLACSKPEPTPPPAPITMPPVVTTMPAVVSVSSVTLGNAIGADKRVASSMDTFGAKDTIYASVATQGTGPAKIRALWTFVRGDKTAKVDETTVEVNPTGPAATEFHVSKPGGWPKGDYRVDVFLGDAATPATTKSFKVS
jgi:hypothetical protein